MTAGWIPRLDLVPYGPDKLLSDIITNLFLSPFIKNHKAARALWRSVRRLGSLAGQAVDLCGQTEVKAQRCVCTPPPFAMSCVVRPITTTNTHTLFTHTLPPPYPIKSQARLLDAAGTVEAAEAERRTAREEATALRVALRAAEAEKRVLEGRLQGAVRCYWRQRAVLGRAMEVRGARMSWP